MNVETSFDFKHKFIEDFTLFDSKRVNNSSEFVRNLRANGIEQFKALTAPNRKQEEWKYTKVTEIINKEFFTYASRLEQDKIDLSPFLIEGLEAHLIVFINGRFSERNSSDLSALKGVQVGNLENVLQNNSTSVEKVLGKVADTEEKFFAALNTAYFEDGLVIQVADGAIVDKPIFCLCLSDASQGNLMVNTRNLLVVGKNAQVKVINANYSLEDSAFVLNNQVSEVVIAADAIVDTYKLQMETDKSYHFDYTQIHQQQSSKFSCNTITLGGKIVRNDLNYLLQGEHTESFLNGLYLTEGQQLVDNHSLVDHAVPNCMSDEFYKGIMAGNSKAVFNGKIMVRPDAQKTNAFQSNKNILVSDNATINTKPQLEIFADDVRCTHGATTGQLNDEAMFYMQARGISKEKARKILLQSFAGEVTERLELEVMRDYLNQVIEERINQL